MARFKYSVTWIDADGDTFVQGGELIAATGADADVAVGSMLEDEDVLSDAAILSVEVSHVFDISALDIKANPGATSDVEIGGRFVFRTSTAPRFYKEVNVPAFKKDDYVIEKQINQANADVIAFVAEIVGGGFSTAHYEDLTALQKGYETFGGKP